MVLLLSERKSKTEKEIMEILKIYGADHIKDNTILENKSTFTVISIYKKADVSLKRGIAVFITQNHRFKAQKLPLDTIGICEENNKSALENFKNNNLSVITCGAGNKNTITISSIENNTFLATLQRSVIDIFGNVILPRDIKITLSKSYSPFAVMVAATLLLLNGISPIDFE